MRTYGGLPITTSKPPRATISGNAVLESMAFGSYASPPSAWAEGMAAASDPIHPQSCCSTASCCCAPTAPTTSAAPGPAPPSGSVTINGNTISAVGSGALLPSTGFAKSD